ncbi:hypothetical protein J437_LFUL008221 [Ladona fulva]|uniref:C2H2-type domain-containing protein n=1 Tax=Ladona fulva TaxID=123851 RepID=A0A8K0K610_LADFU|nr:hypothetical protein J437_LFUL008221 [Ladona fulva]
MGKAGSSSVESGSHSSKGSLGVPTPQSSGDIFIRLPGCSLFLCRMCGKTVSNKWHHFRRHWPDEIPCPICHAVFARKDHLKYHLRGQSPHT